MSTPDTSWREELTRALRIYNEGFEDIEGNTMSDADMDTRFYDGYGSAKGCSFTVWTRDRVYFPAVYDGDEWVASVPRNPCDEATSHVGGQ